MTTSDAERGLLTVLSWARVPTPVLEHRFHPTRKWRFDLAWPDYMLAVEVEGGTWIAGRHTSGSGFAADCEKYNEAIIAGWRILRVTPAMIEGGKALDYIERAIRNDASRSRLAPATRPDGG